MRTRRMLSGIVLLVIVLLGGYSSAASGMEISKQGVAPDVTPAGPVTILDAEEFVFHSAITGRDYRIYIGLPPGYAERADRPPKYPVIYSLDANWHFTIDVGSSRFLNVGFEFDPTIVVGIGYPTDDRWELEELRAWDYRPGYGAEAFLRFIQEELVPYIDATYRTDKQDRTLAGHSYGGLFTLYTLFHDTKTFKRYVAMSPALWYGYEYEGQRLIFDYEAAYAAENAQLPVNLFLSVGELEPEELYGFRMVSNLIEFYEVLASRDYEGLALEMDVIDGLGHAGCYPGAFTRGLFEVMPHPALPK